MSPERTKVLRDAFAKTMNDPELLAEVKKREWEANGLPAEELEALAEDRRGPPNDEHMKPSRV